MQLRTKKNSSKKPVIITLVILIVVVAVSIGTYFWLSKDKKTYSVESAQQIDEENQTSDKSKQNISTDKTNSTDSSSTGHEKEKNITPPYEGENANDSQILTGTINYIDVVDNTLIIRTTINQILDSGTCDLTLTNGTKTVIKTSDIAQNPSSSTCKGFDVPAAELGSGDWKMSIKISSGDRNGTLTGTASI
jgi:uncharacterized protein YxeA